MPAVAAATGRNRWRRRTRRRACSAASTTGWRPPSMREGEAGIDHRPHPVVLRRRVRPAPAATSTTASASAAAAMSAASRRASAPARRRGRARCAARGRRPRRSSDFELAQLAVEKRIAPAMVWRWMKRVLPRRLQQVLAGLLRHLDEVAEHVVVLDAQRPAAGLRRRSALAGAAMTRRRSVAQRAHLVEIARHRPARTKPPSRFSSGSSSASAAASVSAISRRQGAQRPARPRASSGGSSRRASSARQLARRRKARRARGEVARAAAVRAPAATARAAGRARASGHARTLSRRALFVDETRRPHRAARGWRRDRSAARPGARRAAARRPASPCGRCWRAGCRRARRDSVRVSSRLARVAASMASAARHSPLAAG